MDKSDNAKKSLHLIDYVFLYIIGMPLIILFYLIGFPTISEYFQQQTTENFEKLIQSHYNKDNSTIIPIQEILPSLFPNQNLSEYTEICTVSVLHDGYLPFDTDQEILKHKNNPGYRFNFHNKSTILAYYYIILTTTDAKKHITYSVFTAYSPLIKIYGPRQCNHINKTYLHINKDKDQYNRIVSIIK